MRWLGFGGGKNDSHAPDATGDASNSRDAPERGGNDASAESPARLPAVCPPPANSSEERRRETLDDITRFLLDNNLPISPFTLDTAHDIVTGANPVLAALVAAHVEDDQPVTVRWLEDVVQAQETENGAAQLHALILRLETTVDEFANTASVARTATTDYNSALEAHVGDLGAIDSGGGNVIQQLTTLARDMLSRTREVARELTRSERETRTLQKRLADARAEAEIDHLTGLPNRRAFEARYNEEYAATRDSGEPLCVAFCDIDEFKRINDNHGHEAGDRVLRTVAQSLATMSDEKCHVARHGGEEFVVLLRDKLIEEACAVIDEAREMIAARRLINRSTDVPFGRITLSAGVADVHAYRDAREALRAADDALLRAKDAGRNLVLKADPPDHPD
ncbi:diguanylate cyclase [Novosphingobium sp. CF614]|uniref:GGDEF domain-containing protein n=1 Tax=Novosphingobium sp. CF614 TaxID=1884364 RepID=UPI0008F4062F|nr:GGDEF domain-containing protein [Novosphingobium sp. CF614]SFG30293.1 diguanylate cyclase [Novosphingobium sp. CF614]